VQPGGSLFGLQHSNPVDTAVAYGSKGHAGGNAKNYGKFLRWKLFEKYNPMTYEQACRREVQLAEDLRKKRGYAVWQN